MQRAYNATAIIRKMRMLSMSRYSYSQDQSTATPGPTSSNPANPAGQAGSSSQQQQDGPASETNHTDAVNKANVDGAVGQTVGDGTSTSSAATTNDRRPMAAVGSEQWNLAYDLQLIISIWVRN